MEPPQQQQQQHSAPGGHDGAQDPAQHQLVRPDMWSNSLFNCCPIDKCLLGCFLPCIPFGRGVERMKDPSKDVGVVNAECLVFLGIECLTGCGCLYNILRRSEMRQTYGIKGNGCSDCLVSSFCLCCAVIQQEKESEVRAPLMRCQQPVTQGYQGQKEGMHMPAPVYQPGQQQHQPMENGQQPIQPVPMQQPMGYPPKQ
ncbi:PLAC8 family domain-containing protein [Purpureocillium lavendulum]|uniref:PLAC8 family domain-containing protein n=1 Tax=Purpureocillium lavendulum TaxID=1247861 RepID=A0AB34FUC6_9HYPO|nr:PLAC8 family domain-containing protein [Purpureocillium lavendulum]